MAQEPKYPVQTVMKAPGIVKPSCKEIQGILEQESVN